MFKDSVGLIIVGVMALLIIILGLGCYGLYKDKQAYQHVRDINIANEKVIRDLERVSAFNEGVVVGWARDVKEIKEKQDEVRANVNASPDGAASDAVVCAITGVCKQQGTRVPRSNSVSKAPSRFVGTAQPSRKANSGSVKRPD